jgi:hypothetical protein
MQLQISMLISLITMLIAQSSYAANKKFALAGKTNLCWLAGKKKLLIFWLAGNIFVVGWLFMLMYCKSKKSFDAFQMLMYCKIQKPLCADNAFET